MYRIGIDVGSAYTKYCVMEETSSICALFQEKTPVRQREYFADKMEQFMSEYPGAATVSCGYGKGNVAGIKNINELTALAMGSGFLIPSLGTVLDIGGQDTKIICQENGRLKEFFVNDKCAAGSGLFLDNTARLLEIPFDQIDLTEAESPVVRLSCVCAVFAQSEIVELLADNVPASEILHAVIWQIFLQAKTLLGKVKEAPLLLSGGLTQIKGIQAFAQRALERDCYVVENGNYLSAIGCALQAGALCGKV